jgi:hypothetical protein
VINWVVATGDRLDAARHGGVGRRLDADHPGGGPPTAVHSDEGRQSAVGHSDEDRQSAVGRLD